MKRFLVLLSASLILIQSCKKENDTILTVPAPSSGHQTEIQWPSLANTPWPMNHHDPQCTGRSKYVGPKNGQLASTITLPTISKIAPVIHIDSTYLVGGTLISVGLNGTIKWSSVPSPFAVNKMIRTTPIVASDSTIFVASNDGVIYNLGMDGSVRWQYSTGSDIIQQGSTIDKDGVFYCISLQRTLYAINKDGTLKWSLHNPKFHGSERAVLSFSPDGRTLYVPGEGISVHAVDISTQQIRWGFGTDPYLVLAPTVDCNGNIYILGSDSSLADRPALFCLKPDGSVKWKYVHGNSLDPIMSGDAALDENGNINFAFDTLYSVDYTGALRWKIALGGVSDSPIVCDAVGTVYLIVMELNTPSYEVWSVSSSGQINWKKPLGTLFIDSSPALTEDGKLVILGWKNYILHVIE